MKSIKIEDYTAANLIEHFEALESAIKAYGLPPYHLIVQELGVTASYIEDLKRAYAFQTAEAGDENVFVVEYPQSRYINVIKVFREHFGLGLREARAMADQKPLTIVPSACHNFDGLVQALKEQAATIKDCNGKVV